MKWSKEHSSWALRSGLITLERTNRQTDVQRHLRSWIKHGCAHVWCGRERCEGDGDTGEVSAPDSGWTSVFRKVVFSLEEFQVTLSGWTLCLRDFLHQRGRDRITSHLHESLSHLLLLKSKRLLPIRARERETQAFLLFPVVHSNISRQLWSLGSSGW